MSNHIWYQEKKLGFVTLKSWVRVVNDGYQYEICETTKCGMRKTVAKGWRRRLTKAKKDVFSFFNNN